MSKIPIEDIRLDGQSLADRSGKIWAEIGDKRKPTHILPLDEIEFKRVDAGLCVPVVYQYWFPRVPR